MGFVSGFRLVRIRVSISGSLPCSRFIPLSASVISRSFVKIVRRLWETPIINLIECHIQRCCWKWISDSECVSRTRMTTKSSSSTCRSTRDATDYWSYWQQNTQTGPITEVYEVVQDIKYGNCELLSKTVRLWSTKHIIKPPLATARAA